MEPVRAGRAIGLLILVQMISGPLVNFVLTEPLFGSADFLVSAAPHATKIALSALTFDVVAALLQVVAVTMPFFGRDINFALIAPLGLSQLLLALWLLVKGL